MADDDGFEKTLKDYKKQLDRVKKEISKSVIGQAETVDTVLRAVIANGVVSALATDTAPTDVARAAPTATVTGFRFLSLMLSLLWF